MTGRLQNLVVDQSSSASSLEAATVATPRYQIPQQGFLCYLSEWCFDGRGLRINNQDKVSSISLYCGLQSDHLLWKCRLSSLALESCIFALLHQVRRTWTCTYCNHTITRVCAQMWGMGLGFRAEGETYFLITIIICVSLHIFSWIF